MRTNAFLPWNVLEVPAGKVPSMLTFPSTVTRSHDGAESTKAIELLSPRPAADEGVAVGEGEAAAPVADASGDG